MRRFILILIAVPVVLAILAVLLIPVFLDKNKILDLAAEKVKEQTGAILMVDGEVVLSIFPRIALTLGDAGIIMPGDQGMSVKVRALGIGLELMPLFSGRVEVGEISIDGLLLTITSGREQPALDTSSLSDGELDAYYEKRRKLRNSANQAADQAAIVAVPLALNVQRLTITDSLLELISLESGESTKVRIHQFEATSLNLDGDAIPLSLQLQLEGESDSAPIEIELAGVVKVDVESGQLTLESLELGVTGALEQTLMAQTSGTFDLNRQIAELELVFSLGDIKGDGKLRYANFESPQIDAKLHLNKFDPALLALAGPDAAAAASSDQADGSANEQPLPLDAIRAIDTRADLTIDQASFDGHVINNLELLLRAVDGVVRIPRLSGVLHGGKLNMKATLNAKHNVARLNATGGLVDMDIGSALQAMNSEPIMSGKANLEWDLRSRGATSTELMEAMNGPIELFTTDVMLNSMGIEKMLCEVVALANRESLSNTLPDSTQFKKLAVKLKVNKGKLYMKPLNADLSNVKLKGTGELDLLTQEFSATFAASLSPGLAELDPACRVNDRLTAIAWPVNCKGSISADPADWCAVDSQKIIEQMATKELQHQVGKEASKLLDKLFKK